MSIRLVSRIFLSHSSENNAQALAIRAWLMSEGWDDVFLDLDPERGIKAGEQWEQALRDAAFRCEAVLFLVSRAWLNSEWCRDEFKLARHLGKRLFGILIDDLVPTDLPPLMTREWQLVNAVTAGAKTPFPVVLPGTDRTVEVSFAAEGLRRLRLGLVAAGLDARFFTWPPEHDPERPPYRGMLPLEAEDAGIFFGRDAQIVEAFDELRALRGSVGPRLYVILGASGSGKSSFMRAGLLPRLTRDDRNFLPLPILRPARAAISGEAGLVRCIEAAFQASGKPRARADIRAAVADGAKALRVMLGELVANAQRSALSQQEGTKAPLLILPIDQGEELFLPEGREEADHLLTLLRDLTTDDAPGVLVLFTIRSDSYEALQGAKILEGIRQKTFSLPPMPRGSFQSVIEGPANRLRDTPRALTVDAALTRALLADIESGGGSDVLALLAFTLERLYLEFKGRGQLTLADYQTLGGIKGSIEAAVERAFVSADKDERVARDRGARLQLLRRGLIPWLAGIDLETGKPRRRVAHLSEIPAEARPLIEHFINQRLLSSDAELDETGKATGEITIEPTHETLLRQWGLLQGWLTEDAGLLGVLEGIRRATRDWLANNRDPAWLTHTTGRLQATERLSERADLAAQLKPADIDYLTACRERQDAQIVHRRRLTAIVGVLALVSVAGLGIAGWSKRAYLGMRVAVLSESIWPKALTPEAERALKPRDYIKECGHCPTLVVIPAGNFMMGTAEHEITLRSSRNEPLARPNETPQHPVSIAQPFAVGMFEVTFAEWDACYMLGGCSEQPGDEGWGHGAQPVINVSWDMAKQYVAWLSKRTGRPYRLLTEEEWEYAARVGSDKRYSSGDSLSPGAANCDGCGSSWDNRQPAPAGSFAPNLFGLHDMHGNVWELVEDCYRRQYSDPVLAACTNRVIRGGSFYNYPENLRSAVRSSFLLGQPSSEREQGLPDSPSRTVGFRVARSLAR